MFHDVFFMVKYSFIIPVKAINDYIREALPKILAIQRSDYEIIIYPNQLTTNESWDKTRQIASGACGPAQKRNLAIKDAQGEILVFIDDDAYPQDNLLEVLDENFQNERITAVGGPALTPADDSFWQRVSGAVFLSRLSGGHPERYRSLGEKREVKDWPSVNLAVRKADFTAVGGFKHEYWPGEDTLLCLDLIKGGKKIIYDPRLVAWHHRRKGFLKHLKQVGQYGLHRGYFARKFPQTSLKLKYFLPSLWLIFVVGGVILSLALAWFWWVYLGGWIIYALALTRAFYTIRRQEKGAVALMALPYIIGTHLVYGYRFLCGIMEKNLKSKLS